MEPCEFYYCTRTFHRKKAHAGAHLRYIPTLVWWHGSDLCFFVGSALTVRFFVGSALGASSLGLYSPFPHLPPTPQHTRGTAPAVPLARGRSETSQLKPPGVHAVSLHVCMTIWESPRRGPGAWVYIGRRVTVLFIGSTFVRLGLESTATRGLPTDLGLELAAVEARAAKAYPIAVHRACAGGRASLRLARRPLRRATADHAGPGA